MTAGRLLATRRFLPLFLTQFLGAFNDNVFKNALVILITFRAASCGESPMLVTVAAGLFILPFLLFSATAGQLADKYDKDRLIRMTKLAELAIMAVGAAAISFGDLYALLAVLFAMGAQSALFGPLKYGVLPQLLTSSELMSANALIQGSTFIAILIGTIAGGVLAALPDIGGKATASAIVALAVFGWWASRSIPAAPAQAPTIRIDANPMRQTWRVARMAAEQPEVMVAVIGISWFWFVGATFLQLLPGFACDELGGGPSVVTLLLTAFSVGVAVGAALCSRLARDRIDLGLVLPGAFGMGLCALVPAVLPPPAPVGVELLVADVAKTAGNWPVLAAFGAIALFGGLYVVPMFAFIQHATPPGRRARVIAAANVLNALFMVASALMTIALLAAGLSVVQVFAATAVLTFAIAIWMYRASPQMRAGLARRLGRHDAD